MVVVLPVFWSVGQLSIWWRPPADAVVFAVMLALALPRLLGSIRPCDWLGASLGLLVGTTAAVGCEMLLAIGTPLRMLGVAAFAVAVATPVWLRRFGLGWRAYGLGAGLPFVAILVHPLPLEARWSFLGWILSVALIALGWALASGRLATSGTASRAMPTTADRAPTAQRGGGTHRGRPASDRMALQLAVAVAAAFTIAQWIDSDHPVWPVLTALLVSSGNRGRGDVLWKGTERTLGALIGTAMATGLAGLLPAGDARAIVALFAILALAAGLRPFGYFYWSACITAALGFLNGYFGQAGSDLLAHRLLGVAAGSAIAMGAAWVVFPVRTRDVVRQRVGSARTAARAVTEALGDGKRDPVALEQMARAAQDLRNLLPTARAAHWLGRGPTRALAGTLNHSLGLLGALERCAANASAGPDRADAEHLPIDPLARWTEPLRDFAICSPTPYALRMPSAPDRSEELLAQAALRIAGAPTAEILTAVERGLLGVPTRDSDERFEQLAMKADASQAKLRARRTGH